jgi:transposase
MSNHPNRRVYTREYKHEAVQLARTSGKTLAELERELGLSKGLLKHWMRQVAAEEASVVPGHGRLKADEELRRLQRENEILRQERALLKKVASIFSREPPRSIGS